MVKETDEIRLEALAEIPEKELKEYSMLVFLKQELYESSWDKMLEDLRDRMKGRPYIFIFVNRIEEDIERIDKLQRWEMKYGGKYVSEEKEFDYKLNFEPEE